MNWKSVVIAGILGVIALLVDHSIRLKVHDWNVDFSIGPAGLDVFTVILLFFILMLLCLVGITVLDHFKSPPDPDGPSA